MEITTNIGAYAYPYTALATLIIALLIFVFMSKVGKMRAKHEVKAPAMSGNTEFDCANRVHQNTIEQTVIFLPVLWLFAATVSDLYAGVAGTLWIIGRILYSNGYMEDPSKRGRGFMISFLVLAVSFLWTMYAIVMQLV